MAATYEPIASTTLTSIGNVDFTSIPTDMTDLVVVVNGTCGYNDAGNIVYLRMNGDSATNYSSTYILGNGSSVGSSRFSSYSYGPVGNLPVPGSTPGTVVINIFQANNTNVYKTALSASANTTNIVARYAFLWRSTAAITSLRVASNYWFDVGTTVSLFGIKAAA